MWVGWGLIPDSVPGRARVPGSVESLESSEGASFSLQENLGISQVECTGMKWSLTMSDVDSRRALESKGAEGFVKGVPPENHLLWLHLSLWHEDHQSLM